MARFLADASRQQKPIQKPRAQCAASSGNCCHCSGNVWGFQCHTIRLGTERKWTLFCIQKGPVLLPVVDSGLRTVTQQEALICLAMVAVFFLMQVRKNFGIFSHRRTRSDPEEDYVCPLSLKQVILERETQANGGVNHHVSGGTLPRPVNAVSVDDKYQQRLWRQSSDLQCGQKGGRGQHSSCVFHPDRVLMLVCHYAILFAWLTFFVCLFVCGLV